MAAIIRRKLGMDIQREMVETILQKAVWADERIQQQIVQELASYPEETFDALLDILQKYEKPLLVLACQAIHAIGYPKNANAIPQLVYIASDQNVPGRFEAIATLAAMDSDQVIPFLMKILLNRDDNNDDWSYSVDGISTLLGIKKEWILACGPAVVFLLAQNNYKQGNAPDREYLLSALENIIPEYAVYAIPTLYHIACREIENDIGAIARRLLFLFDGTTLKPYKSLVESLLIKGD